MSICPVCGASFEQPRWRTRNTCSRECGQRLRRGDPDERFWSRVDQSGGPDACWPFMGYCDPRSGYGCVGRGRAIKKAHRVAYALANGGIDESLDVLHSCDNPPCCNPDHLSQGTHADNMRDMVQRDRQNRPKGERNGRAVLSDEIVCRIRRKPWAWGSQTQLARELGIDQTTISGVRLRKKWAHVVCPDDEPNAP